jgi:hypothetical protein
MKKIGLPPWGIETVTAPCTAAELSPTCKKVNLLVV